MTTEALAPAPEATQWSQEAIAGCVATVVRSRRATRAFRAEPLPRELVEEILEDADTCPQVAFAQFHEPIAAHLHMSPDEVTAFGMSMGYGDPEAEVNQTRMPRERVQDFARLLGFAA
ncbi:nitroreductase [Variovorax boronicumulans]|uniref:nitroreductase family protein n=1 Tax=Variovorax boronicumulans TaxID=436515 RepID=UPI0024763B4E|nr:nitroreductase family protein [Variovorax boronicumulans]MDH6169464.1 nitroreductase [Variovorax boronicumulans]